MYLDNIVNFLLYLYARNCENRKGGREQGIPRRCFASMLCYRWKLDLTKVARYLAVSLSVVFVCAGCFRCSTKLVRLYEEILGCDLRGPNL